MRLCLISVVRNFMMQCLHEAVAITASMHYHKGVRVFPLPPLCALAVLYLRTSRQFVPFGVLRLFGIGRLNTGRRLCWHDSNRIAI